MKVQFVYAELIHGITSTMLQDPHVTLISDNGVFLITTEENSKSYPLEFYPVNVEAIVSYELEFTNGRMKSGSKTAGFGRK